MRNAGQITTSVSYFIIMTVFFPQRVQGRPESIMIAYISCVKKLNLISDKLKAEKRLRVGVERENRFLEFNQNVTSISQSTEHPIGYHPMTQSNCIFQNYHPLPSIQTTSQFPFQFNSDPIGSNNSNIQEIKFKWAFFESSVIFRLNTELTFWTYNPKLSFLRKSA